MIRKTAAKIILINDEGEILFLIRGEKHPKYAGDLDLPGGIVKPGETPLAGLLREVEEECQIALAADKVVKLAESEDYNPAWHYYLMAARVNYPFPPQLSWEHAAARRYRIAEIDDGMLAEARDSYMKFALEYLLAHRTEF